MSYVILEEKKPSGELTPYQVARVYLPDGKTYLAERRIFDVIRDKSPDYDGFTECLGSYELKNFKLMPEFNTSAP